MNEEVKEVKKLKEIHNKEKLITLCEVLTKGHQVSLVVKNDLGPVGLFWEEECLFTFDVCRCGNPSNNAIAIVRDLMNIQQHQKFTYKEVSLLLLLHTEKKFTV